MPGGHVGFYGLEHAIPETDSGADGVASGCFCFRVPHRIAATKLVQQQQGERAVGFLIHLDVTLQVIKERRRLLLRDVHTFQEGPEHQWNDMFPAERKCSRNDVGFSGPNEAKAGTHELEARLRRDAGSKSGLQPASFNHGNKLERRNRVSLHLTHGLAIKVEVAYIPFLALPGGRTFIGFLAQHNFVYETPQRQIL